MVGTVAAREPGPSVGNGRVGTRRLRRNVERSRRNGRSRQSCTDSKADRGIVSGGSRIRGIEVDDGLARIKRGVNGGAGRRRTNHRRGFVGINADEFVKPVRTDVPNGESSVRGKLALDAQRPGDERGSFHVRLNPAGNELCARRRGSGWVDGKARNWK